MTLQCKGCPWRKSAKPRKEIKGYSEKKHCKLTETIAEEGDLRFLAGPLRVMACHESRSGAEKECVGWVENQMGVGNNIGLRLQARDGRYRDFRTVGPQHQTFGDTLPRDRRSARG